jgi:hypothetical protein
MSGRLFTRSFDLEPSKKMPRGNLFLPCFSYRLIVRVALHRSVKTKWLESPSPRGTTNPNASLYNFPS